MNGALLREEAAELARRAQAEAGANRPDQIRRLMEIALSRPPAREELDHLNASGGSLESLARVILSSNEFAYVE